MSNGSGAFTYVYNAFTPGFDAIRYGIFNGSGKSDLVAYNSASTLGYALLGNGSGDIEATPAASQDIPAAMLTPLPEWPIFRLLQKIHEYFTRR